MNKFSTWGLTYQDACSLIHVLKIEGVDAHITAGGITMYPDSPQGMIKMHEICGKYGATAVVGNTLHQEMVLNPKKANKWINDRAREIHGEELGLPE